MISTSFLSHFGLLWFEVLCITGNVDWKSNRRKEREGNTERERERDGEEMEKEGEGKIETYRKRSKERERETKGKREINTARPFVFPSYCLVTVRACRCAVGRCQTGRPTFLWWKTPPFSRVAASSATDVWLFEHPIQTCLAKSDLSR